LEALYRDYHARGVQFFFIYKELAHPGKSGYIDPVTLEERLLHIAEFRRTYGISIPWICDNMANDLKKSLGGSPNSEFVIDPQGKIIIMRDWSNPKQLREDLAELVGAVAKPTRVEDLNLPQDRSRAKFARGVMPSLEAPENLRTLKTTARPGRNPFYAKLHASAEPSLLETGAGALKLSFQLDPIHHVHWNNLAAPLEYEIHLEGGGDMRSGSGKAVRVKAEADSDPREFLVFFCGLDTSAPFELTVRYFACSDDDAWCKPVEQTYNVRFEMDRRRRMDAGSGGFSGRRFSRRGGNR